jgi:hypothetical protein
MEAVIRSFAGQGTEDVFDGFNSKEAHWKDGYADEVEIADYH